MMVMMMLVAAHPAPSDGTSFVFDCPPNQRTEDHNDPKQVWADKQSQNEHRSTTQSLTMAAPPSNPTTISSLLSTHRALLDTVASFLTVCTHHIIFLRRIYPLISFAATRAYDYPVRQNRHPDVCTWINDAVAAIRDQLEKNTVEKVALCIFECKTHRVLERWTIDLHSMPVVPKLDHDIPFAGSEEPELRNKINLIDLEASFRATLSRITTAAMKLRDLPQGPDAPTCSFTLSIEVRDRADRPVGRLEGYERRWVVAEPEVFEDSNAPYKTVNGHASEEDRVHKTHPVRRLQAGEIRLEVWVEEASAKFDYPTTQLTPSQRAAALSYGEDTEKFDPEVGYELEKKNINRNTGDGIGTDYQRG